MRIQTPQAARLFLFAGHAKFTIVSVRTGTRFTYKLDRKKDTEIIFLKVLCGPDMWKFVGCLYRMQNGRYVYKHSTKAQISEHTASVTAFKWFINYVQDIDNFHEKFELWHEGKCGKCGRPLTVPESIATGLGPDCAAMMGITWTKEAA